MRVLAGLVALFATTSALAQTDSSLLGPDAGSTILPGGWAVTGVGDDCRLTHTSDQAAPDLIIQTAESDQQIIVAVPLLGTASYPASTSIRMVVHGTSSRALGQASFTAVKGGPGTLLIAPWQADQVLPQLTSADRLEFYGPDQRLIRSVRLNDVETAVAGLKNCHSAPVRSTPQPPLAPRPAGGAGWLNESDAAKCYLSRTSDAGDEVRFTMLKRSPQVFLSILAHDRNRFHIGQVFRTSVMLEYATPKRDRLNGVDVDGEEVENTEFRIVSGADGLQILGTPDASILLKLRQPLWESLSIDLLGGDWFVTLDTSGLNAAVVNLVQCAQQFPE